MGYFAREDGNELQRTEKLIHLHQHQFIQAKRNITSIGLHDGISNHAIYNIQTTSIAIRGDKSLDHHCIS